MRSDAGYLDYPSAYTISVVIPAYNIADYIRGAIESALAQTYKPLEIIVVDDGSTDSTADVVKRYSCDNPQVKYIRQSNTGVSAACNTGIKAARGNWIAFLDGDDIWQPEKLQLQVELLQRNSELIWCICNSIYKPFDEEQGRKFLAFESGEKLLAGREYFASFIYAATYHIGWNRCTMLVKRRALLDVGMFEEGLSSAEELDLWLRVAYRWPQIGYVNRPLVTYVWNRPGSLAARPSLYRLGIVCGVLDKHLELSRRYDKYDEVKTLVARMIRDRLYDMYRQGQYSELKQLMARYGDILPARLKAKMRFKTACPRLARWFFVVCNSIKRMAGG